MNNALLKTDDATAFITKALNDFFRDKNLTLTSQQYDKLKKLLMVCLLDEEMSYENAYGHLCDIREHRKEYEIDANAPDEAEEEMIRIIGAADVPQKEVVIETTKYKKPFMLMSALCTFLVMGLIGTQALNYIQHKNAMMTAVIGKVEEDTIKSLVQQVVTMETNNGNTITHSAVYKDIKNLNSVKSFGTATSYKKFNRAQYEATVEYLRERIEN